MAQNLTGKANAHKSEIKVHVRSMEKLEDAVQRVQRYGSVAIYGMKLTNFGGTCERGYKENIYMMQAKRSEQHMRIRNDREWDQLVLRVVDGNGLCCFDRSSDHVSLDCPASLSSFTQTARFDTFLHGLGAGEGFVWAYSDKKNKDIYYHPVIAAYLIAWLLEGAQVLATMLLERHIVTSRMQAMSSSLPSLKLEAELAELQSMMGAAVSFVPCAPTSLEVARTSSELFDPKQWSSELQFLDQEVQSDMEDMLQRQLADEPDAKYVASLEIMCQDTKYQMCKETLRGCALMLTNADILMHNLSQEMSASKALEEDKVQLELEIEQLTQQLASMGVKVDHLQDGADKAPVPPSTLDLQRNQDQDN